MRRHNRGFLSVELTVSFAIFGILLFTFFDAVVTSRRSARINEERLSAASRLGELTEGVRHGDIAVSPGKSREVPADEKRAALRNEKCTLKVEPWPGDKSLSKVTVTVCWYSARRVDRSVEAVTLVRTDRLKIEGGKP